jgi:hypothetical protein
MLQIGVVPGDILWELTLRSVNAKRLIYYFGIWTKTLNEPINGSAGYCVRRYSNDSNWTISANTSLVCGGLGSFTRSVAFLLGR